MSQESATDVVRSYLAAFNDRDHEAMKALVADDAVQHGIHSVLEGHDDIIDYLERHFAAFPDYSGTTHLLIADDDIVAIRYEATGTHTGEYREIEPTGHRARWTGMAMYRVADGRIAEMWIEEDRLGLLEQLELVDTSEPAHLRI